MFSRIYCFVLLLIMVCRPVYSDQTEKEAEVVDQNKVVNGNSVLSPSLDYWMPVYHFQVNSELFKLINYPYYPGCVSFVRTGPIEVGEIYFAENTPGREKVKFSSRLLSAIDSLVKERVETQVEDELKNSQEDQQTPEVPVDKVSDSNKDGGHTSLPATNKEKDIYKFREYLESCSDLIFRWRQLNESPQFMLELLRSVKITETESGIFKVGPDIAVQIKRTIGSIAKLNENFDFTSRVTMEAVLAGEYPRAWLSRQEKQLADLKNRLVILKDLNDKASIALGLGPVDRSADVPAYLNPVYFEIIETPDSYKLN